MVLQDGPHSYPISPHTATILTRIQMAETPRTPVNDLTFYNAVHSIHIVICYLFNVLFGVTIWNKIALYPPSPVVLS